MTATRAPRPAWACPDLPRLLVVAALAALVVVGPWAASPAHAAEITFTDPQGLEEADGQGTRHLLTAPGAQSSYAFGGTAEVEPEVQGFSVEVVATREDTGEEITLCSTSEYSTATVSWVCWYVPIDRGALPTSSELEARLIPAGADEPVQVARLDDVTILSPPEFEDGTTSTDSSQVTLRGTKAADFGVEIVQGGLGGDDGAMTLQSPDQLCADYTVGTEAWSCTFDLPDDTVGTHEVSARQVLPPWAEPEVTSNLRSTIVERTPTPGPGPDPEPGPGPGPEPTPEPGPTPTPEPSPAPDAGEEASGDDPAPPSAAAPPAPFEPPDPETAPSPPTDEDPSAAPGPAEDAGGGGNDDTGAARAEAAGGDHADPGSRPSDYGTALRPLSGVLDLPVGVALAGAAAAVSFLLFVAIPAELLYSTLRENYARVFVWPAPLRRTRERLRSVLDRPWPPWLAPVLVLVGAAGLGALAEPDPAGPVVVLRLFLAVLISLTILNGAGALISSWVGHHRFGQPVRLVLMPAFLLIAALSVLASRQLGLQPGILFGLLVTVAFGAGLRREQAGRISALVCTAYLGLGVLTWLLHGTIGAEDTSFTGELLREVLTTITIGTIGSIVVALLPLTFLDGRKVLAWSRPVWALLYALTLVLFVFIVVPLPDSWVDASRQSIIWSGTFGAFGLVSVATWAWFRWRGHADAERPSPAPVRRGG